MQIFLIKREGMLNQRRCFKKGGNLSIFILSIPFQSYLSLSEWCVCVLLIGTISINILCVSWEKFRLIDVTFTSQYFLKTKYILGICKVNF